MSYLVLARKYRPRGFDALVGQEHVVQALSNALTQGRLHHAYLFTGTRGVGKTTVSRLLAKSLNCTGTDGLGGITAQSCGVCSACRDIDSGRFVDYIELDAASNRGVEEISLLLDQAVYKPVVGRFKVYMIDEVHMLSNTAFNAMLKTLEEPPDYLKFILATTDPQKVPATVLSRCLQFNLRPMAPETVQRHLEQVMAQESIPAEAGALRLLARAARGSMRDALSLADQAIAFGAGTLTEVGVRQMLGSVDRDHAVRLVEALAAADGPALVAAADHLCSLGLSAAATLEEVSQLFQQIALAQAVPGALDENDLDTAAALRLSPQLAADEIQLFYSIALQGRAELTLAPDEHSGLVMVLLRMLAFKPASSGMTLDLPQTSLPTQKTASSGSSSAATTTATATAALPATATPVTLVRRQSPAAAQQAQQPPVASAARSQVDDAVPPWIDAEPLNDEAIFLSRARGSPAEPAVLDATATASLSVMAQPPVPSSGVALPGDRWVAVVAALIGAGRISALVRELAVQAQCLSIDESVSPPIWHLRVEREVLRAGTQRDRLQAALCDYLGGPVVLELSAGVADDSPALRDTAERQRRQREAEQTIQDDPLVQSLMAQFKTARIVPGSVKPH